MKEEKEQQFNDMAAEQAAINSLIGRGFELPLGKRSLLSLLGINKIYEPYTGTLDLLADVYIKMEIDEEALKENPVSESNRVIKRTAVLAARAVAIAWLNGKWKCRLFTRMMTVYFLWRIKPSKLYQLAMLIRTIMNAGDFISSIRLMSGTRRTTMKKPDLIEGEQKA